MWGASPWAMFRDLFVQVYVRPVLLKAANLSLKLALWL